MNEIKVDNTRQAWFRYPTGSYGRVPVGVDNKGNAYALAPNQSTGKLEWTPAEGMVVCEHERLTNHTLHRIWRFIPGTYDNVKSLYKSGKLDTTPYENLWQQYESKQLTYDEYLTAGTALFEQNRHAYGMDAKRPADKPTTPRKDNRTTSKRSTTRQSRKRTTKATTTASSIAPNMMCGLT